MQRIIDSMAHRGPDGDGIWSSEDRRVMLGHQRLAIIDLSDAGAQPMTNEDGTLVISLNGEIYNYQALRKDLEKDGCKFRSNSDTEVLLHLFSRKKEAMLDEIRGMFAFAIWDAKRDALFLARDPYGIKPLYYSSDSESFRAASQVKALLAGGAVDTSPEPGGHVGFHLWGHVPEPFTMYRGIKSVPAGSYMWVERSGHSAPRIYASIPSVFREAENEQSDLGGVEPQEYLRNALLDTVRHHLVADVEVGVFLSSGLDSTTLVGLASESAAALRTITLAFSEFKNTDHDESVWAEKIASQYGTRHETIWVGAGDFQSELQPLLERMDQPTIDGVNSYFVSKAAAQAGLKVAISGLGGDELFGGYPSFTQIPRLVSALRFVPFVGTVGKIFRTLSAPALLRFSSPKTAGILELGSDYGGAYLLRRGLFMPWELPDILDGELLREGWRDLQPFANLSETTVDIESDAFRISALESQWYMKNQLLRDSDWASMAHSLEIRVPLVDWKLLKTIAPLIHKVPGVDKKMMSLTPKPGLPEAIINRKKTGFAIPVRDWLSTNVPELDQKRGLRGWAQYVYKHHQGLG